MPITNLWPALETICAGGAVHPFWRRWLGEDFNVARSRFLETGTDAPARSFPCPRGCGCWHEVLGTGTGEWLAACQCETGDCPDFPLTRADLDAWRLSWPKLARTLAAALELRGCASLHHRGNTRQIGAWSAESVPVFLSVHEDAESFHQAVAELVARLRAPLILLAPTAAHLNAESRELLGNVGAGFFPLEEWLAFRADGELFCKTRPGELFARFTPQPKEGADENLLRRAFALVRQLDTQSKASPPTVLTVFREYCIENRDIREIARITHCSPGTIVNRLRLIRQRTGMEPAALRQISGHVAHMEEELSDPRARRIYRRGQVEENEDEED